MKKKWLSLLMMLLITILSIQAQVKFPENIEHVDPLLPLIDQVQIKGTHWSVLDKTARNAIPDDKREVGMLVTWIESFNYVTKRFEAVNALDVNWTNDDNWFGLVVEPDTITYSDTSFFSLVSDTALFALKIDPVDSINFNGTSKETHNEGNLIYDTITHSLTFQNDITDFNHNLGYELVVRVYNESGAQIDNGTVVTLDDIFINGTRTPTIKKAGMGSTDSLNPIGILTVDTPNDSFGIVTLIGEAKGLNTSLFLNATPLWVGNDGQLRNTSPPPPDFSLNIGFTFYSHATEGSIYIQPQPIEFDPSPHISGDTSRYNVILDLTQNIFEYIPISDTNLQDSVGFTRVGDSLRCDVSGFVTIALNLSYTGNIQNDIWRKGLFVNGDEINTVSRSTSSTSVGNSTVIATINIIKNDWISFKMTNESADRDPTINDLSFEIIFLHL